MARKDANNFDPPKRMGQRKKNDNFIPRLIKDIDETEDDAKAEASEQETRSFKTRSTEYLSKQDSKEAQTPSKKKPSKKKEFTDKQAELPEDDDTAVLSPQLQLAPQRRNYYRGTKVRKASKLEEDTEHLSSDTLKIIPLGGLWEVGKNCNLFEFGNDLIVGDAGQMFPGPDQPGIDAIIPDFTYVKNNADKFRAIFVTHGHEDHIGSIPYLLREVKKHVPIYAGNIAAELLKTKFEEFGLHDYIGDIVKVESREVVRAGVFEVEFVTVNHSIADAFALAIKSPVGTVIQSGDWKIDFTPVNGEPIDLARFAQLGEEGVLCFIGESTNVEREGYTISETNVGKTFEHEFSKAEGRVFVATFASNTSRVQQIINAAENDGRKVALVGRSMLNVFNAANKLGYISMKSDTLIELDEVNNYPDNEVCVISTGSQGEPMSALTRMAFAEHRSIEITDTDTVIISATPIPGNEKPIYNVINELYKRGATVVYSSISEVHVSGHANREELKVLLTLLKPKYLIPAHGEYRMLYMHAELARSLGMPAENIFILNNGDIFECNQQTARIGGYTSADAVLVDGSATTRSDSMVLKQRSELSDSGILSVAVTLDENNKLMTRPQVLSYGALLENDDSDLVPKTSDFVANYINKNQDNNDLVKSLRSWKFRVQLQNFFREETGRRPITLVSVLEYDS